jgi:hypothetical protein
MTVADETARRAADELLWETQVAFRGQAVFLSSTFLIDVMADVGKSHVKMSTKLTRTCHLCQISDCVLGRALGGLAG